MLDAHRHNIIIFAIQIIFVLCGVPTYLRYTWMNEKRGAIFITIFPPRARHYNVEVTERRFPKKNTFTRIEWSLHTRYTRWEFWISSREHKCGLRLLYVYPRDVFRGWAGAMACHNNVAQWSNEIELDMLIDKGLIIVGLRTGDGTP